MYVMHLISFEFVALALIVVTLAVYEKWGRFCPTDVSFSGGGQLGETHAHRP